MAELQKYYGKAVSMRAHARLLCSNIKTASESLLRDDISQVVVVADYIVSDRGVGDGGEMATGTFYL